MKAAPFALFIVAALFLGLGQATAAPNLTDLSVFGGRVVGTGDVKLSNSAEYHGKGAIRPTITAGGLAAKFKVIASVKVSGHSVQIPNEFAFTSAGRFLGSELAPGDTSGLRTKGKFTATGSVIAFSGKFKAGTTEGTFSGTVEKFSNGRLTITYSVFVGDGTPPLYVYTYTGK